MKMNKIFVIIVFAGLMLPLFASQARAATDSSLSNIVSAGKIVIGTEAAYAPYESVLPNGTYVGFDVEIAKIIATSIGVSIEWKNVGFDTLVTGLAAGQFDCVISAMTITAEREEQVDFSRWYVKSEQAIMVPIANPKNIDSVEDLNSSSIKIGVQQGTASETYVQDSLPTATLSSYSLITLAVQALQQGSVDVVLGDYAPLYHEVIAQANTYKIVATFDKQDFGIAVKSGSTTLLNKINSEINGLLGNDVNNPVPTDKYNEIYKEAFESDASFASMGATISSFPILGLIAAIPIGAFIIIKKKKAIFV